MVDERRNKTTWQVNVENQISEIKAEVAENTAITAATNAKVAEVHDVLLTIKGGLKVLSWLASVAKWFTAILGLVSAGWLLWYQATHHGDVPAKIDIPK